MLLMLELVSVGLFGACLSAFLCTITKGTPYEVPKVISFEEGFLRPRIVRSVNWPKWKRGDFHEHEEGRKNVCRSQRGSEKRRPEVRKNHRQHVETSVRDLEPFTERTVAKTASEVEKYLEEDVRSPGPREPTPNSCKYCGSAEISNAKCIEPKDRSLIARSVTRIKSKLRGRKIDEYSCAECSRSYDGEWRKARPKRRRSIVPKSSVIAKKPEDDVVGAKAAPPEDPIDEQLRSNPRYCYLEALRTKTNKADENV